MIYYITPREFGGLVIPIPIQNAYLRHFSSMKNINFSLPVSEVCFPGKYSALSKIISRACHERETIVLVSIHQLPFDKAKEFEDFLSKYKEYKKINLIAALEGINTELYEAWKTYREEYIPINKICSRLEWQI